LAATPVKHRYDNKRSAYRT